MKIYIPITTTHSSTFQAYNINHVTEMTKADPFDYCCLLLGEEVILPYHMLEGLPKIRITLFFDDNVPQKHV